MRFLPCSPSLPRVKIPRSFMRWMNFCASKEMLRAIWSRSLKVRLTLWSERSQPVAREKASRKQLLSHSSTSLILNCSMLRFTCWHLTFPKSINPTLLPTKKTQLKLKAMMETKYSRTYNWSRTLFSTSLIPWATLLLFKALIITERSGRSYEKNSTS